MKPGWYILNYHDINYEDSILTRAIGGTIRPDVFYEHLKTLTGLGNFVTVEEGLNQLFNNVDFNSPTFSIWFDDGFYGLKEHALKICNYFNIQPTVSVCSRFVLREEMFWRCKMSALAHTDGMRFLRTELRNSNKNVPFKLRKWTLENFTLDLVGAVDKVYQSIFSKEFQKDAFRIFLDKNDIEVLVGQGWSIANHSASHYPLSEKVSDNFIREQFIECQQLIDQFDHKVDSWVIPFGFGKDNFSELLNTASIPIVHVENQYNSTKNWDSKNIYRYEIPNSHNIKNLF